jgi:hypothetical protein
MKLLHEPGDTPFFKLVPNVFLPLPLLYFSSRLFFDSFPYHGGLWLCKPYSFSRKVELIFPWDAKNKNVIMIFSGSIHASPQSVPSIHMIMN